VVPLGGYDLQRIGLGRKFRLAGEGIERQTTCRPPAGHTRFIGLPSIVGFGTPVRALPISRYLEIPRETVRRHMGRLVALGLFERAEDQTFVPTKQLREVEIDRALRLLRHGTAGLL
jgi:hypothetical protein